MSKLLTKAESLYEKGFQPIPTVYKRPIEDNWQNITEAPNGNFKKANGVGIVLGREVDGGYLSALDVDCYNKNVSRDFYLWLEEKYGPIPYRIGTKPKFMVPFICTDYQIKKSATAFYENNSRIEMLGLGQQFVAYGFADEGVPYKWHNGELDMDAIPRWTVEQVNKAVSIWEKIARESGMRINVAGEVFNDVQQDDPDDFLVDVPSNREDITFSELTDLIHKLEPENLPYEKTGWIEVGMAIHHQSEGSDEGLKLWIDWSRRSSKHNKKCSEKCMKTKWKSFSSEGKKIITLSTVRQLINIQSISDEDNPFEEITDNVNDVISKNEESQDFLSVADIQISDLSQFWQVEDMLEKGSIAQVYGASYTGKSYFIMYMAACMSSGHSFGDKRAVKSKVIYVYGEGNHGVKRRFQAVKQHYPELDMSNLHYSKALPNLMDEKSFLKFGKSLKAFGGADVIIFDTLARSMSGGDENSAMDMGLVLQRLAKLRDVFGCSVIVVHHSGKDASKGARGSSATYAGMDNEIKVEKDSNGVIQIESTKAKDSPEYKPMNFRFVPVVFNIQDNFGRDITSATVEFVEDYEAEEAMKTLSPSGREVVDVVKYLAEKPECHVTPPVDFARDSGLDSPSFGILSSEVREQFERRQRDSATPDSTIRQKWRRGLQDAVSKGILSQLDEVIVIL